MTKPITIIAITGIPLIQAGDNLTHIILQALADNRMVLQAGDVLVVTSKIVSKAEGRMVELNTVQPRPEAIQLAEETRKDPRIVELALQESHAISRKAPGILITRHRLGFTSANSGIDQSNIGGDDQYALLLPLDPDKTAAELRETISQAANAQIGIVISDTHGRPFRQGNVGVAIGAAGIPALLDLRGQTDLFGRELKASIQGYADLIASAAHLISGEADEGIPVVLIRGLRFEGAHGKASDLVRSPEQDLYR